MSSVDGLELGVVGLIVTTLVLTGPVAGVVDVTTRNPTTVGDGTADVTVEHLDTDELGIDRGRFGTGVYYLRIPDATVAVSDAEGNPRVLYRVQVPSLDVDVVTTELLRDGQSGTVRLGPRDRGLGPSFPEGERRRAIVTIRVQSSEQDITVFERNETVRGER